MSLERFCRPVVTTHLEDSVAKAARKMRDQRVGCLVVDREGTPHGIVTDRDLTVRVLANGLDPRTATVSDVATFDPIVVRMTEGVETAARRMREHGIRRLPIVDERGKTRGLITADDVVHLVGKELGDISEGIASSADATDSR